MRAQRTLKTDIADVYMTAIGFGAWLRNDGWRILAIIVGVCLIGQWMYVMSTVDQMYPGYDIIDFVSMCGAFVGFSSLVFGSANWPRR